MSSKFKIGDRVKSMSTGRTGTIVPEVRVQWDGDESDRYLGVLERIDAEPIPDGLVVEFTPHFADSDIGRGAYTIKGIDPQKLNGKFRLVPVE